MFLKVNHFPSSQIICWMSTREYLRLEKMHHEEHIRNRWKTFRGKHFLLWKVFLRHSQNLFGPQETFSLCELFLLNDGYQLKSERRILKR